MNPLLPVRLLVHCRLSVKFLGNQKLCVNFLLCGGAGGRPVPPNPSMLFKGQVYRVSWKKLENLFPHCNTQLELTLALSGWCVCSPPGPHTSPAIYICFSCLSNTPSQAPVTPAARLLGSSSRAPCILGHRPTKCKTKQMEQKGSAPFVHEDSNSLLLNLSVREPLYALSKHRNLPDRSRTLLLDITSV